MPRPRRSLPFVAAMALALGGAGGAMARDVVVHAGTLIDGVSKQPRHTVSVIIHDDRIVAVKPGFVSQDGAETIDLSRSTVLPGLIDVHVHLMLDYSKRPLQIAQVTRTSFDDLLEATVNARKTLLAGFTSVRDLGGYTPAIVALRNAQRDGTVVGPRMWVSGSLLGPTGGHADFSNGFDAVLMRPEWSDGIIDGADSAIKKVREHHRAGVDLIKIVPSGGVASIGDDPQAQLMTDAEIKAVVDTAHTLHMKVAAHAHGTQAIEHAAERGVDSIEHGTYADDAGYRAMKARGSFMVPTIVAGAFVADFAKAHPGVFAPSVEAKALAIGPIMSRNAYAAWKAGVHIAFGTDSGVEPHGDNAREFELMVKAGIPPMDTILAATSSAAALIGDEQDIGSVQPGHYADLVATDGDPLSDISQLRHIRFVMQGGKVVKDETAAPR